MTAFSMFSHETNRGVKPTFFLLFALLVSPVLAPSAGAGMPCGNSGEVRQELLPLGALYEQGWQGDNVALLEFFTRMEKLESSLREQPLLRAYYGSACVARARLVTDHQKPRWLRRGMGELDEAVAQAPEDLQVRLLRAVTCAVLPRLAGRSDTAASDFEWLLARARKHELSDNCRQTILYHAGAYSLRNRDARAVALLEEAAGLKVEAGIEGERINRLLRLARKQVGQNVD